MNELTPTLFVGVLLLTLLLTDAFIWRAIRNSISSQSARVETSVGFWGRTYSAHPRGTTAFVDAIGVAGCCTPLLFLYLESLQHVLHPLTIGVGLSSMLLIFVLFRPFWGGRTLETRFNRMRMILEAYESRNRNAEAFFLIKYNWKAFVTHYTVSEQMDWLERMVDSIHPTKKALEIVLAILQKNNTAKEYQIQFLQRLVNRPDSIGTQAHRYLAEGS